MEKTIFEKVIKTIQSTQVDTAIEIPSIPGMKSEIIQLINWSENNNFTYFNLNELEFSEQNEQELYKQGFTPKNDVSAPLFSHDDL